MPARDNRPFFDQLISALPFGVYVLAGDRKIRNWNPAAESISGYLSQEMLGRSVPDDFFVDLRCDATHDHHEPGPVEKRYMLKHKAGHSVPVVCRSVNLLGEDGGVAAFVQMFQQEEVREENLLWIDEAETHFDPVLGAYNSSTTEKQLRSALAGGSEFTLYFLEISEIDKLTKKHGTEMTNAAIRTLIHTVMRTVRVPHYLGLWERALIVLVPGTTVDQRLHDELSKAGALCAISWWGDRINLNVRIARTVSQAADSVVTLIERLRHDGETARERTQCS